MLAYLYSMLHIVLYNLEGKLCRYDKMIQIKSVACTNKHN